MKTLAVFFGLMVTGSLVVMLYLWSGESLIVLALALLTILVALWLFQQRPWEGVETPANKEFNWDLDEGETATARLGDATPAQPKANEPTRHDRPNRVESVLIKLAGGLPPSSDEPTKNSTSESTRRARPRIQNLRTKDVDDDNYATDDRTKRNGASENNEEESPAVPESKPLAGATSDLRERVFGRKRAVFDLEEKEDDDRLWWDGHAEAEKSGKDLVETSSRQKSTQASRPVKRATPPSGPGMQATGKKEVPLPPVASAATSSKLTAPAGAGRLTRADGRNGLQIDPRTDTIELRTASLLAISTPANAAPPQLDPTLELQTVLTGERLSGPEEAFTPEIDHPEWYEPVAKNRSVDAEPPQPKANQAESIPPTGHQSVPAAHPVEHRNEVPQQGEQRALPERLTEPSAAEIRPARASYDITCDKKGISGVPEKQHAPQLWAWQQIDDMGLDVHPSTGLMTLRLGFPNLRNPNEPAYAWIEFGPEQDPDHVMDEARAGWRISKIPRSQFFRLSPQDRTRQLRTFLTAKEIRLPSESIADPVQVFNEIRAELISSGGLTQLSPHAQLADVLNQFSQLIDNNKIKQLTSDEIAELEALGVTSTLPDLYWSLDWFMEQRGKRIAFVDEHRRDYLFGLIPAHLADHWDGQGVGANALVILDIP